MRPASAELRLVRIMAMVIAIGAGLFCWLALDAIRVQWNSAPPSWSIFSLLAVFGAPVAAAALAPTLTLVGARITLATAAALYLIAAFGTLALVAPLPGSEPHWVFNNTAAATSAAALAVPRSAAWMFNVVISVILGISSSRNIGDGGIVAGLQDALYSFMFCAVFIALAQLTIAQARRVDEETGAAGRHAAVVAAAHARQAERGRVDALLHDTVLAALMLASRGGDRVDTAVRRQAADAVHALAVGVGSDPVDSPTSTSLSSTLRERLARIDPRIPVASSADQDDVPVAVAAAIADAAGEAVRNALRHAALGDRVPTVTIVADASGARATVSDDGVGFDLAQVPDARLGLRASVIGRLEALPGGTASIDTAPGRGTTIRLEWRRPT